MVETQVCTKCGVEQPFEQFSWKNKKKRKRNTQCKACHAAYRRQHYLDNIEKYKAKARYWNEQNQDQYRMNIRKYVLEYLLEHPCVDCGESDPIVLEFDHVRGEKVDAVGTLMRSTVSLKRIKAEIEKCEVRCANCHRRKTAKEGGWHMLDLLAEYSEED